MLGFPTYCVGREYEFKFVVEGNEWVTSEDYPIVKEGKGEGNNTLVIAEEMIARPAVGNFGSMETVRRYVNKLHVKLAEEGFSEFEVQQPATDITVMTRTNPFTLESYTLIARSAFSEKGGNTTLRNWRLPAPIDRFECFAQLHVPFSYASFHKSFITGLPCELSSYRSPDWFVTVSSSYVLSSDTISFEPLPAAFVCVVRSSFGPLAVESMRMLHTHTFSLLENRAKADELVSALSLPDVVYLLWRCGPEEVANTRHGRDVYKVPSLQWSPYAGFFSLAHDFRSIEKTAKHPLLENLIQGNWMMDYHCQRVSDWPLPEQFKQYFFRTVELIRGLPRARIPGAYRKFVVQLEETLRRRVGNGLFRDGAEVMKSGDADLIQKLAYGTTPFHSTEVSGRITSISCGLPLNCIGAQRRRGRDTFIAFPGALLRTGRFKEAERELFDFAKSMQEGLIANHLCVETGTFEYHTRDTTWWFVRALKEFVGCVGTDVLRKQVTMRFGERMDMQLQDVLQRIMQSHATGIHFRNPPHGAKLHPNWHEIGLDIVLELDTETGLVYGGLGCHCDTWMNNVSYGQLKTPRDGAPIEVTALLYSAVSFLADLYSKDVFPYEGVWLSDGSLLTYQDWAIRIKSHFEILYWLPIEDTGALIDPSERRIRGVYKDTVGAFNFDDEFILRPNQCIAMAIAPSLFDPAHAAQALISVEAYLIPKKGVGMYLEPPSDVRKATESLWVLGYYLKARNEFRKQTLVEVMDTARGQREMIQSSRWGGLPDAVDCQAQVQGNNTQLRSVCVLLEALVDIVSSSI